jgi:hypothetical protein
VGNGSKWGNFQVWWWVVLDIVPVDKEAGPIDDFFHGFGPNRFGGCWVFGRLMVFIGNVIMQLGRGPLGSTVDWAAIGGHVKEHVVGGMLGGPVAGKHELMW